MIDKRTLLVLLAAVSLGAAEPRGWLGIYHKELDQPTQVALGVDHGVLLTSVVDSSPAATAGLKTGDVILAVDSEQIYSTEDLSRTIGGNPEKTVKIEYLRQGKTENVEVKLGARERQLEFTIPGLAELEYAKQAGKSGVTLTMQDYGKDLQELKAEIAILRKEIERLRRELKKLEKEK